jgi:hypothetical protein
MYKEKSCIKVKFCAVEILKHIEKNKKVNIKDKDKIIEELSNYIDKILFNIVAIAALISLKAGVKKILQEHMMYIDKYINKLCNVSINSKSNKKGKISMKGGAFNTAAFFGVNEPNYSETNLTNDVMNVDFVNNIARPALNISVKLTGGGRGGMIKLNSCKKVTKQLKNKIISVFKYFKINIDKNVPAIMSEKLELILDKIIIKIIKIKDSEINIHNFKKIISNTKILKK